MQLLGLVERGRAIVGILCQGDTRLCGSVAAVTIDVLADDFVVFRVEEEVDVELRAVASVAIIVVIKAAIIAVLVVVISACSC